MSKKNHRISAELAEVPPGLLDTGAVARHRTGADDSRYDAGSEVRARTISTDRGFTYE